MPSYRERARRLTGTRLREYIRPMLAKLSEQPFDGDEWLFEIKWDGYRAIAEIARGSVKLYSRNGISFENVYPALVSELANLPEGTVLDGEVVALAEDGSPSFQLLQQYNAAGDVPLVYYAFDCLRYKGRSVEDKTLIERKEILWSLLGESPVVRYSEHIAGRGKDFFTAATGRGLEGVMAKKADSVYRQNMRTGAWLKVKVTQTEEAVIAGYTRGRGSRKFFGALILGTYKSGKLVYIGHTGTGFDDRTLKTLYAQMRPLEVEVSPFDDPVPVNAPVTWLRPELVCSIKFSEVTEAGSRRHPVFLGVRIDKDAKDVRTEVKDVDEMTTTKTVTKKKATPKKVAGVATNKVGVENNVASAKHAAIGDGETTIDRRKLIFTNTAKVFWPEEGITKGDVISYYNDMAPLILPYLRNRPESMLRMPNGIKAPGFFHKDAGHNAPAWANTYRHYSESAGKDVNYLVCNNRATLLYMANLGCIEMNPWNSRLATLEKPDYLVMDIDPSEKNTFEQVVETALVIRDILERAGAASYPKTSGATGVHIYVPLGARYTYELAREFAHVVAQMAHEQLPGFTSLERSLARRGKGNIYIDYLQNRQGQTLASAYSLRPKPGAPVSTPLLWKEVKPGLHPSQFHIGNIAARVRKKGDLFAGVLGRGVSLQKCLKRLGG